jgi:hypothetical protein
MYIKRYFFISEVKQTAFLSTGTSDCRGGTGLKAVFVLVCGNLQHMTKHKRYDAKYCQN